MSINALFLNLPLLKQENIKQQFQDKHRVSCFVESSIEDLKIDSSDLDCLFVALSEVVDKSLLDRLPKLKYLGVWGSTLKNIDVDECKKRNIHISNVPEYCDFETAEFMFSMLLNHQRVILPDPISLGGKKLGIIGMGSVAQEFALLAKAFNMEVTYTSRSEKKLDERFSSISTRSKISLLQEADYILLSVPPNTCVLNDEELGYLKKGTVIISACLGETVKASALKEWLDKDNGFCLFDAYAAQSYKSFLDYRNIHASDRFAFLCKESVERINQIVFTDFLAYLNKVQ